MPLRAASGVLRILRDGPAHPARNMALDEALLLAAGPPTLRLYGWTPPGLSLGYFQAAAGFTALEGDHVLVRRLTGGGAIFHQDEITFALTVDAGALPADVQESYDLVNRAVAVALRSVGVRTEPPGACDPPARAEGRRSDGWCFAAPCGLDLVHPSGGKILGSAQRRIQRPRPRVLHHGSLVLTTPGPTPFCASVALDQDPREVEGDLRDALVREIAAAVDLRPREGRATADEEALAGRLQRERYEQADFTLRR